MQTSFSRAHATMLLRYSGISFISGAVNHGFFSGTRSFVTAAVGSVLVVAGSVAALQLLHANPQWLGAHAHVVSRSVAVAMGDDMRFTPSSLQVTAGETVRMVLTNRGQVDHELVIGTPAELKTHAQAMREGHAHAHAGAGAAAIRLAPGATGELVVTFREAGPLEFACLIPGHFEAGMRGGIAVAQAAIAPAAAPEPGHGSHKH